PRGPTGVNGGALVGLPPHPLALVGAVCVRCATIGLLLWVGLAGSLAGATTVASQDGTAAPGAKVTAALTERATGENVEGLVNGLSGEVATAAIDAAVTTVAVPIAAASVQRSERSAPTTRP